MANPIENTIEQYAKEVCALLPLHRLCIFFFYIVFSNYTLNETPSKLWRGGENIIPQAKSFWVYLTSKNLYNYFSIDNGVLLHGNLDVYLVAIFLCVLTYAANRYITSGCIELIKKMIDSDKIFTSVATRASSIRFADTLHMLLYLAKLNSQKKDVEVRLKYLNFYAEMLLFVAVVSLLSLVFAESSGALDLAILASSTIAYLFTKYIYVRQYLKKLKPLVVFIDQLSSL